MRRDYINMPVSLSKRNLGASTLLVLTLMACLAGIASGSAIATASAADNVNVAAQNPSPSSGKLTKVSDSVWVHTSYFNYNGWPTPSNGMIIETAAGLVLIDTPWTCEQTMELLNTAWQRFHKKVVPGPAHTADNIAIYFAAEKALFGGCVVKSLDSNNLGNISEGSVANYQQAVQNLIDRYGEASIVIPGHGSWGGRELLTHTLDLAKAAH